ncbi:MAG: 5-bromo-4-chloroindolyl phosphate hydrolysis family protein [Ruthenibacterium sp.]
MSTQPQKPKDDFDALGKQIEDDVKSAVSALGGIVQSALATAASSVRQGMETAQPTWERARQSAKRSAKKAADKAKRRPENYAKKANGEAGTAGGLALAAGIMTAVTLITILEGGPEGWTGALVLAVIAAWLAVGSVMAYFKAKRLRRTAMYMNLLGERTFITAQQLAAITGKSERVIRTDLQKMLADGSLQGTYLSPDGTRLFAGEMAYQCYLAQQEDVARRAQEQADAQKDAAVQRAAEKKEKMGERSAQGAAGAAEKKPQGTLAECDAFAAALQRHAVLIDDTAVTQQVDALVKHTLRIRAWLAAHPGQEARVRRFTSYYLPTVIKLLNTYEELSPHAVTGSVAAQSRQDITEILSSINTAFQTLEDGLVQDTAMNVSAEISALQAVMAQDGLTQDGMFCDNAHG